MSFTIDPRLEADTVPVASLGLCDLRLMNDSRFPWLVLVPRLDDAVEIHELDAAVRQRLTEEIALVARVLSAAVTCDKVNVGALGNIVRQLHVHVVVRRRDDAAWPGPVWGSGAAIPYAPGMRAALVERLRAGLS